jgi:NTE family protein
MIIAICLSGGGAKGDFQLGALEFLYEQGFVPDILCSTSAGSVNAIKLAEGENPTNSNQGLRGLQQIWASLQRNSDMYVDAPWLSDPDMDPRIRDYLTDRSKSLAFRESPRDGGRWGDLGFFIDAFNDLNFLLGDGAAILKSLNVFVSRARSLYELWPIADKLHAEVDLQAISDWAASGKKLRMATVALESGRIRFVTESGALIERDGAAVLAPSGMAPECRPLADAVDTLKAEIAALQDDLQSAAPGEKPAIVRAVREAQEKQRVTAKRFEECVLSHPQFLVPLKVDLRSGVLASAAIPGIFPPVQLGSETYVDGGVRDMIPIQPAVDLGAERIFAVSAFPFDLQMQPSFSQAHLGGTLARSVEDILLNEVALDDLRMEVLPGRARPELFVISPDVEIHGVTTIDPGLIQINRDYGWMRAADVLAGVTKVSRLYALATEIAQARLGAWRLENRRFGHEDPTRLWDPAPAADASLQGSIDDLKRQLATLIGERRSLGGAMPNEIERWTKTLELHPWSRSVNDAQFMSQEVPNKIVPGQKQLVSLTFRNVGTTVWSTGENYRLGSQAPQDNVHWGQNRVELPAPVSPGQDVTFKFGATAPPEAQETFQWRMVQDGREWFGNYSLAATIERDQPVRCSQLRQEIGELDQEIADLQSDLRGAAPGEKAGIARQIRAAQDKRRSRQSEFDLLGCK